MFKHIILACLLISSSILPAQYSDNYFDVGLMGGISNYFGDLSPAPFKPKHIHFAAGAFGRYNIGQWVSVKASFNYGRISADDLNGKRPERNLNFRSNVFEFGVTGEWNLVGYHPRALEKPFSPYVFIGIAGYHFNPQSRDPLGASWVDLQPLGTEGQLPGGLGYLGRTPYKRTQFAVPMGLGIKWAINNHWGLGLELGFRKTFTDYLDDVSLTYVPAGYFPAGSLEERMAFKGYTPDAITTLRGDSNDFDWYLIAGLSISYHFVEEGLAGSRKRLRRKPGCKGARF